MAAHTEPCYGCGTVVDVDPAWPRGAVVYCADCLLADVPALFHHEGGDRGRL